jgi:hypothetical protein
MNKNVNTSNRFSQNADNTFCTQLKIVYHILLDKVATASMVERLTGIHQKNICRYKRSLEKAGLLWQVKKDYCKITGFKAWYLTTNPDKVDNDAIQLTILYGAKT